MSARVDEVTTRSNRVPRPLGKPCRSCGSTSTWVEWRREVDGSRPGGVGEWPYAVCQTCGDAAKRRLLFFSTEQLRYVVVELKIGKFEPAHLGQLGTYAAIVDDQYRKT